MDALKLKDDIVKIKNRLDVAEQNLQIQINELSEKENLLNKIDSQADEMMKNGYGNQIITFNICGKKFQTKLGTLLNSRDTLFYKMVLSSNFDPKKEIFFDCEEKYFEIILDFLRTKKINLKRFSHREYTKLRRQVNYFEIQELIEMMGVENLEVEFENFEFSGPFLSGGVVIGSNKLEDISNVRAVKGICANSPGWIIITLNREFVIKGMIIGGFRGNTTYWLTENGSYSTIKLSLNKSDWTNVGTIPSGYGSVNKEIKFSPMTARYIKFENTTYLGIGYLKIIN